MKPAARSRARNFHRLESPEPGRLQTKDYPASSRAALCREQSISAPVSPDWVALVRGQRAAAEKFQPVCQVAKNKIAAAGLITIPRYVAVVERHVWHGACVFSANSWAWSLRYAQPACVKSAGSEAPLRNVREFEIAWLESNKFSSNCRNLGAEFPRYPSNGRAVT